MNTKAYRVDKFVVPAHAREEFLEKVHATHELLRSQAGFLNFVTIVEWENDTAMEPVRQAVAALHERMNFDPHELFRRLGIRADLGNYERV